MRLSRHYVSTPISLQRTIELDAKLSHYLIRVLRLQTGDRTRLFNATNGEYEAELTVIGKNALAIIKRALNSQMESPLSITLVQAISKGERMNFTLQKAIEMGVNCIIPFNAERTQVKLSGSRLKSRMEHWQQVCISACEQSGRVHLPQIKPPISLDQLGQLDYDHQFVLNPCAKQGFKAINIKGNKLLLLIGPEGGLSDAEILRLESFGFQGIRLGPRIMRTETLAISALSCMQTLWGDLG